MSKATKGKLGEIVVVFSGAIKRVDIVKLLKSKSLAIKSNLDEVTIILAVPKGQETSWARRLSLVKGVTATIDTPNHISVLKDLHKQKAKAGLKHIGSRK